MGRKGNIKINTALPVAMLCVTALASFTLVTKSVSADDVIDEINITVPVSCSMSGTDMDSHTAEIANGTSNSAIGETTINALCNDANGFAIYAIGFTDDTEGKNVLSNATLGSTYDIATGTATSGTSQWAMKVTTPTSPTPTYPVSIENDFDDFHTVPDDYAMVAKREAATDIGASATGSTIKTTYQAYIDNNQPAGTYTGQVKYVLVHPHDGAAPEKPISIDTATTMQEVNICSDTLTIGQVYTLTDSRDNQDYKVAKLADGNCWLLDNLALDLTNSTVLNGMNESNTHASNTTLNYLKGTTTRDPSTDPDGQYATAGVSNWTSSYSYSAPLVNLTNKDAIPSDATSQAGQYKVGGYYNFCAASAGSYCYGDGTAAGTSASNATEDICPKGWRLPTGNTTGEYSSLANAIYGSTGSTSDPTAYTNYRSALRLPLSGYFISGSAGSQGNYDYFWSSTRGGDSYMYILYLGTSDVSPSDGNGRLIGSSVRCVLGS